MAQSLFQESKKIFVVFVVCFVFVFVILNIIQFFNFMSRQVAVLAESSLETVSPSPLISPAPEQNQFPETIKKDSLEIPKLNLEAPLVFATSQEIKAITQDLKSGVVVYPTSSLPGQKGRLVILGHSSPPGWPKIRYDWVFSKLGDLEAGDIVTVNFANFQYDFQVVGKTFLEKGQALPQDIQDSSKQFLYLITCWPPGKDFKRLAVKAELSLTK